MFAVARKNFMNELMNYEAQLLKGKEVPEFNPGDTLKVHVKVIEGERERIQVLRVSVLPVEMLVSVQHFGSVKSPLVKVLSGYSHSTLQKLTRSKLPVVVMFAGQNSTIYVSVPVNRHVSVRRETGS